MNADVVVVGGSVAGSATAAFLARRGHNVVILDRARFPRDKPCGEGLMPHGVDLLSELGVLDRVRASGATELTGVRYTLDNCRTVRAGFPSLSGHSSVGLGIRRLALDQLLLDFAREFGSVQVLENFRVVGLVRRNGAVVGVTDGHREVRASVVVGADGIRSTVRRSMGWDVARRGTHRYAALGHFRCADVRTIGSDVHVVIARGLEVYVTPVGRGEVLVALLGGRGFMRHFSGDLSGGYERVVRAVPCLSGLFQGAKLMPGVRAIGPFAARASCVAGSAVLLVGDAAGFLDPITGEGMASALQQACAAATVIDTALRTGAADPDLSTYALEHRRITATGNRLTWVALSMCNSQAMAMRAMAGLQRRPELFAKLLAINCGYSGLRSVTPRDWLALVSGR